MSYSTKAIALLMSLTALPCAMWAQTTGTGTMVGNITDMTGSVLAGAKVTVVSLDTAFTSTAAVLRRHGRTGLTGI